MHVNHPIVLFHPFKLEFGGLLQDCCALNTKSKRLATYTVSRTYDVHQGNVLIVRMFPWGKNPWVLGNKRVQGDEADERVIFRYSFEKEYGTNYSGMFGIGDREGWETAASKPGKWREMDHTFMAGWRKEEERQTELR